MELTDFIALLETYAPPSFAAPWDSCGVQVAGQPGAIQKVACMLDPMEDLVKKAVTWGADIIVSHHPLTMAPQMPQSANAFRSILKTLLSHDTWFYAAHTSLDANPDGPVGWLADALHLADRTLLARENTTDTIYVIKGNTLSSDLQSIASQVTIFSQNEHFGVISLPEHLASSAPSAIAGLGLEIDGVYSLSGSKTSVQQGYGVVGELPQAQSWADFSEKLQSILGNREWKAAGPMPASIGTVAYCPGSGSSFIEHALKSRADIYITGDLKHHQAIECHQRGLFCLDVGHFVLEEKMMEALTALLDRELASSNVKTQFFPGTSPFTFV